MRGRKIITAAVAASLVASAPAGAAELAVSGGFESPDIPTNSFSVFSSIPGWTPVNACGIEVQDRVAGTPLQGGQFVELNSKCKSGVSQTLTLQPSRTYRVSFAFSPRPGTPADYNRMTVAWNGLLKATVGPVAGGADTAWTRHTFTATAASTAASKFSSNTLSFYSQATDPTQSLAQTGPALGVYLDAVSVTCVETKVAPCDDVKKPLV